MKTPSPAGAGSAGPCLKWVASMGGPLIAVPESGQNRWDGCTMSGLVNGDGGTRDDYDRACEVDGLAGVITVGPEGGQGLVLADEPATTCYLPEQRLFVRWLAAWSEADLVTAAAAVLADPKTAWEACGIWETDGPAVLMDSAEAGAGLDTAYPGGNTLPEQAPVPVPPGRWTVRAAHVHADDDTWVGLVQLLPAPAHQPG
ncbi:Imm21 family immunity protein [Streptomyces sp. NPDC004838]